MEHFNYHWRLGDGRGDIAGVTRTRRLQPGKGPHCAPGPWPSFSTSGWNSSSDRSLQSLRSRSAMSFRTLWNLLFLSTAKKSATLKFSGDPKLDPSAAVGNSAAGLRVKYASVRSRDACDESLSQNSLGCWWADCEFAAHGASNCGNRGWGSSAA